MHGMPMKVRSSHQPNSHSNGFRLAYHVASRATAKTFVSLACLNRQYINPTPWHRRHYTVARCKTTSSSSSTHQFSSRNSEEHPSFVSLRRAFDDHAHWTSEYRAMSRNDRGLRSGLFLIPDLTEATGLLPMAQNVHKQCQGYIDRIIAAASQTTTCSKETAQIVPLLDELSDVLVSIMDMSEFVRHYHPDPAYSHAADQVIYTLGNYMNQLNTDERIYKALMRVYNDPDAMSQLSEEAQMVARVLRHDFEQSGVHLNANIKATSVALNNRILERGTEFQRLAHAKQQASLDDDGTIASTAIGNTPQANSDVTMIRLSMRYQDIPGLPDSCKNYIQSLHRRRRLVMRRMGRRESETDDTLFPMTDYTTSCALSFAEPEAIRRIIYMASYQASNAQLEALEDLLIARFSLAKLHGFSTYAHYYLKDKTINDPSVVMSFLQNMAEKTAPLAEKELLPLRKLKASANKDDSRNGLPDLYAWDRLYYTRLFHEQQRSDAPRHDFTLSHYFSIGRCMEGLSRILHRLYGIRLVPAATREGELWDPTVRKLYVVQEQDSDSHGASRLLGTIYCDLFSRRGKPDSAAHYTIRCAKRMKPHLHGHPETATDNVVWSGAHQAERQAVAAEAETILEAAAGDLGEGVELEAKPYRTPIVVIVAGFGYVPTATPSHLCQWSEVDTLFHEMGHAIHSMLAQTEYHNVAGTRCKIDFVEVPSILMEFFLRDYHVTDMFARHYRTGERIPRDAFEAHVRASRQFEHLDQMHAIHHAMLDQLCHGDLDAVRRNVGSSGNNRGGTVTVNTKPSSSSSQRWSSYFSNHLYVQSQEIAHHPIPAVRGTSWQAHFTHLFGYGSGYYSYLLCRLIAREIWRSSTALSTSPATPSHATRSAYRRAGDRIRRMLLQHGGAKEPLALLRAFFQDVIEEAEHDASCNENGEQHQWSMSDRLPFLETIHPSKT